MTEFLQWLIGVGILAAVGYGGFLAGRDQAERSAARHIADLRRANMGLRKERDRYLARLAEIGRWPHAG